MSIMTDYLAKVLQLAPDTWTHATYTSSNYVTVELNKSSQEYMNILSALACGISSNLTKGIRKIERVQHPFAYGRFVLRKEQLENRDSMKRVSTRYFLQVKEYNVEEALAYNMDARRTPFVCSNSRIGGSKCVVVVQSFGPPSNWQRDCESYPEYVVYYNNDGLEQHKALVYNYRDHISHYDEDFYDRYDYGYYDSDLDSD